MSTPEIDIEKLTNKIEEFGTLQKALLARVEARVDLQEQMLAAMVTGYVELASLVHAFKEVLIVPENEEQFAAAFLEQKRHIIEALGAGQAHAENTSERFTSQSSE